MKSTRVENIQTIRLSRTNIETLLHSHRGIIRQVEDGTILHIVMEEDDEHYKDRPEAHPKHRKKIMFGAMYGNHKELCDELKAFDDHHNDVNSD